MNKYYNKFGYILIEEKEYNLVFQGIKIANNQNKMLNALKLGKSLYNNKYFLYMRRVEPILYTEKNQYLIKMQAFITAMDMELLDSGDFSLKLADNNPSGMISVKPKAIRTSADLDFIAEYDDTNKMLFGIAEQNEFKDKIISYNRRAENKFVFQHKEYHFVHKTEIDSIVTLGPNDRLVNRFIVDKDYGLDKTVYG